ncbi:MAG: cell surface protein, partial [Bacteroidetes bacterium]|nr:cell surface protein [Bacteroidota bacterium]
MKTIYNLKFGLFALILFLGMTKANAQCSVTFTATYNSNGNVSFNSTSAPGMATSYYWGYYNGATWVNAGPNPSYTYPANGTYTVSLFAMFGPSVAPTCSALANAVITVTNALCPAGFNASYAYTVGAANTVTFASTSTGTTGSTTFLYKFGDGNTANTANAVHAYSSSGNYLAKLILTDGSCVDSTQTMISVQPPCSLTASFTSTLASNGGVNVTSTSTGTSASSYYSWWWGDGSPVTQGPQASSSHIYSSNGSYIIWLTIQNSSVAPTCTASTQQTITITTGTCNYNPSFTYTNVGSAGQVNFSSTSTGTSAMTIHKWNFNDGTGFFYGNPISHNFANGGMHNVMLHLKDSTSNCVDSLIQQVNVTSFPCTANSNFTLMFSGTPQLWYAAPAYAGNVLAAQWSWGDGTFSNNLYTSHTYSTAGMYNICLTVT